MKMEVAKLSIWNWEDFCEYWDFDISDKEDFNEGVRILKFELGSRGEQELIEDVKVIDGFFECRDTAEIKNFIFKEYAEEDESAFEFANGEIEEWFEDSAGNMLSVYGETIFEELGYVYVRVEV